MFYVYEHWRTDKDEPFYVGKGKAGRAYNMSKRNRHHKAIVAKLYREGFAVEIRIVASNLSEEEAFSLEIKKIKSWREMGIDLANLALGGGTNAGFKLSEKQKKQIGEQKRNNKYRLGAVLSEETKDKIRKAHQGKPLSEQHKKKLSEKLLGKNNPFYGKKHSKETGKKIAEANRNRVWSKESRDKLIKSLKARPKAENRKKGWKLSDETKKKQSEAAKLRWIKRKLENAA